MDQRSVDKAIKKLREEFAASLTALEAKIQPAGASAGPTDTTAIEERLDGHDAGLELYRVNVEELGRQISARTTAISDAVVTRLTEAIDAGRQATGKVRDDLWEEFNRRSDRERAGTASKISALVDKVDAHVAEMEKRLTDHSGELTEKIDSVRRRVG